jgi:hypothetical protein
MGLSWMAWTWPTAAFFIVVVLSIATMGVWEHYSPGGNQRRECSAWLPPEGIDCLSPGWGQALSIWGGWLFTERRCGGAHTVHNLVRIRFSICLARC